MGATASKTPAAVASASRSRVIRTNVSLEQLVALSHGAAAELPAQTQVAAVEMSAAPIDSHGSHVELMEMQTQMLDDVQKIEEFDRVKFLEESTRAFEAPPVATPTIIAACATSNDKTNAASSRHRRHRRGEIRGRLTSRDLRTLLRLHYEKPQSWTHEVLADKYGLDVDTMRSILSSVGPPNVLPPKGTSEHPLGVWFDAPGQLPARASSNRSARRRRTVKCQYFRHYVTIFIQSYYFT
ncbi:Dual specificity protein phosphatase 1B [Phytophthora nicotianae]|uniref:Dual specificity protein phosphatase 1B n=1 Tax=Phytophthora nicotianae TaxID=4792 RepID=A0A0W8D6D2_PHYNI|nr:Dual specificity protein phosphatase 1B [Phytophthora nicotianae]